MSMLEFVAAVVDSIAWPFVILGVAILFRQELTNLPATLKSLKYKDVEVTFQDRINTIEYDALSAGLDLPATVPARYKNLLDENKKNYNYVIVVAWNNIELALRAGGGAIYAGKSRPISKLIEELHARNVLSDEDRMLLEAFRDLRNKVAHSSDVLISREQADRLLRVAIGLLERLKESI